MSGTERRRQNFILSFIVSQDRVYSRGQHMQILLKEKEVFTEKTHLLQDWCGTQTGHQYGFRDVM